MAPHEYERAKQQLIATACSTVEDIQTTGKLERSKIDVLKAAAIQQIEAENQERQFQDDTRSQQRAELIQLLGKAAQAGNFAEMERIKQLLDNDTYS